MSENSSRGLLIAILIVVALNLVATLTQTGMLIRSTAGVPTPSAQSQTGLPPKYTDSMLAQIANRVIDPYDKNDVDALYGAFDEIAKNQIPRDKFVAQLAALHNLVGNVESSSFVGSQKQQTQGRLDMYQLNYVVKLSGSNFPTGTMTLTVVDKESGPGIVGFVINGRAQQ